MENNPHEKNIEWMEIYNEILGLNKKSFHEIYYDDYEDKKNNIAELLKAINGKVNIFNLPILSLYFFYYLILSYKFFSDLILSYRKIKMNYKYNKNFE